MTYPRYVRPDRNWARLAMLSATSEDLGYEAAKAANGDPAWPWWATSGTATLTCALDALRQVDIVAIIHSNVDVARAITIGGDLAGATAGAKRTNGYARNVVYLPNPGVVADNVTIAVAANTINLAIGEVVIGQVNDFGFPIERGQGRRSLTRNVLDDTFDAFAHVIRYDMGSQVWQLSATLHADDAALAELEDWFDATKGGSEPTLIQASASEEWRLCRMDRSLGWTPQGGQLKDGVTFTFTEIGRGIMVV